VNKIHKGTDVPRLYLCFKNIIQKSNFKHLILSYNSEGIMSQEDIIALMSNYGKVAFEQFLYARFKSNNKGLSKTKKTVYEQVYILTK
jgi:adenine-specific DNA-methyltransferase